MRREGGLRGDVANFAYRGGSWWGMGAISRWRTRRGFSFACRGADARVAGSGVAVGVNAEVRGSWVRGRIQCRVAASRACGSLCKLFSRHYWPRAGAGKVTFQNTAHSPKIRDSSALLARLRDEIKRVRPVIDGAVSHGEKQSFARQRRLQQDPEEAEASGT